MIRHIVDTKVHFGRTSQVGKDDIMTLFLGKVCDREYIGDRQNVHRLVGEKGLLSTGRATRDGIGIVMTLFIEFGILGVHDTINMTIIILICNEGIWFYLPHRLPQLPSQKWLGQGRINV